MNSTFSSDAIDVSRGLKSELRRLAPPRLWQVLREVRLNARLLKYRAIGRPQYCGETAKARGRRMREGFFKKYCVGRGLDIGYGGDLLSDNCVGWDLEHGNAQLLDGISDETFDLVYSSHMLEHLDDGCEALRNWYRVVRPGGYLILFVPDRDLYEKKLHLPSQWNPDHKRFFLLDRDDPPDTFGLLPMIDRVIGDVQIVSAQQCSEGHTISDPNLHSDGEYSLEVIVRKPVG
jgi:SAM-dependent methyltransferase